MSRVQRSHLVCVPLVCIQYCKRKKKNDLCPCVGKSKSVLCLSVLSGLSLPDTIMVPIRMYESSRNPDADQLQYSSP